MAGDVEVKEVAVLQPKDAVEEIIPLDSSEGEGRVTIGLMEGEDVEVVTPPSDTTVVTQPIEAATPPVTESQIPETLEAPVPGVVSPQPPITPELQQYIGRLEEQTRVAQQQDEVRFLDTAIKGYAQVLEERDGFTPEQALSLARREGQQLYSQYQAEQFRQGQINAAFVIGAQYKVDPRALMQLPTPQAMEEVARRATERGASQARISALEKENADLKRAAVPAGQHWESGRPAPAARGGRAALLDRYVENPSSLTPQEKASLFPDR